MAVMQKVTNESASHPAVKEVFTGMQQAVGEVPEPLRMLAISPGLFELQTGLIGYYRSHATLSAELLACIRYAAASQFDNVACIKFNGGMLMRQGMTEQELETVKNAPKDAPLEEKDRTMLAFVLSAVKGGTATKEEMETLHDLGFSDSDILDAVNHGFAMFAPGRMLRFFGLVA